MKTVLVFSILLVAGLVLAQWLPAWLGPAADAGHLVIHLLTMTALAYIMVHVGMEFHIDKTRLGEYGWDYIVAMTAAAGPWLLVALYFIFILVPSNQWSNGHVWQESLLVSRFAAPTSAGVLFSMLAAAGMRHTWVFRKARVLAIFDDLDTVLLMIPLKMMMVGVAWQLVVMLFVFAAMLAAAWRWMRSIRLPMSWPWVLTYSALIAVASQGVSYASKLIDRQVPIDIEVLLPAFLLGVALRPPRAQDRDPEQHHREERVSILISGVFMLLVGLNMPPMLMSWQQAAAENAAQEQSILSQLTMPPWHILALHVVIVTALCNLGKMFPAFCYRKEAHWRLRTGVAVGMWPRGEVGAGVLVVSLGYGIAGPAMTIAVLSLALNLVLTGLFILLVKRLIEGHTENDQSQN
ncbi:MAG: sodium:proton antiporter [Planctomycetaceae bacterium]|nr:hypothetical protein [Planctomycetaceae bacterium]